MNQIAEQNYDDNAPQSPYPKSALNSIGEWIKTIVIAAIIAIPIRYFVAEPFIVRGASMDPTFDTNQFLIIDRIGYRLEEPKRDDVIVFKYPNNPSVYYIKRIIGLPGETIKIRDGKVSINDVLVEEPYISNLHKSHENTSATLGFDEYFVMGDNRAESSDSREWGPLNKSFIIGRPFVRIFPFSTMSFWPGEIPESSTEK